MKTNKLPLRLAIKRAYSNYHGILATLGWPITMSRGGWTSNSKLIYFKNNYGISYPSMTIRWPLKREIKRDLVARNIKAYGYILIIWNGFGWWWKGWRKYE